MNDATKLPFARTVLTSAVLAAMLNPAKAFAGAASVELSALDGSNGFVLNGILSGDQFGVSVSGAGDVNGDGLGDVIVGANRASPNVFRSGQGYVVFGSSTGVGGTLDLSNLNGTNGFALNGITGESFGFSVSGVGDVNGDGTDDLIVGAEFSSRTYVVFGSTLPFPASLELSALDGTNGFALNGISANVLSGRSVSGAGDVNGDGIGDLIIGAPYASLGFGFGFGQSYVVFGNSTGFAASFELSSLNGINGFALNGTRGAAAGNRTGKSVSAAGDFNGDGIGDLIVGAPFAGPNGSASGQSYVVFGSSGGFAASLELSSLDGANGFAVNGTVGFEFSGFSVSAAGDVNGDGFDDIIVGAYHAGPNGVESGQSYVVFGASGGFGASLELSSLNGANGFAINGIGTNDRSGFSVSGAGDVNGDGFADLIVGAPRAHATGPLSGQSYVVFGSNTGFGASLELSSLNGANGFALNGVSKYDESGSSVSGAGDVNGDGLDDLIIGAPLADLNFGGGLSFVVFGVRSAAPPPNDLLLDFGAGAGIWSYRNNATWRKLHSQSGHYVTADMDASGIDEVVLAFDTPGIGTWIYRNDSAWEKLHAQTPQAMIACDLDANGKQDLVMDFGAGVGLWLRRNDSAWERLHTLPSNGNLACADVDANGVPDLLVDFGPGIGLWLRMNDATWVKLHNLSAARVVSGQLDADAQDELVIDFGAGIGLWRYDQGAATPWTRIHPTTSQRLAVGDIDGNGIEDLIVDFGAGVGIWQRLDNGAWQKLHALPSVALAAAPLDAGAQADVVVDFGPGIGIWRHLNNTTWQRLHTLSTQPGSGGIVSGNLDGL